MLRRTHLGRHLYELNRAYKKVTMAYLKETYPEFTEGYLQLLSQLDLQHPTPTAVLIARMGVSKQAVSRTLKTCEKLGYVQRQIDPEDSRVYLVGFTSLGLELMTCAGQGIARAEAQFREQLGQQSFEHLKETLASASKTFNLIHIDP